MLGAGSWVLCTGVRALGAGGVLVLGACVGVLGFGLWVPGAGSCLPKQALRVPSPLTATALSPKTQDTAPNAQPPTPNTQIKIQARVLGYWVLGLGSLILLFFWVLGLGFCAVGSWVFGAGC